MSIPCPQLERKSQLPLRHLRRKSKGSSEEDSDNKEQDEVAMLAKNFRRLMKNPRSKKEVL
jgi:hypothetical protein